MAQFTSSPALQARAPDVWGAMQRGAEGTQMNQLRQMKMEQAQAEQGRQSQLREAMPGVGAEAGLGESAQKVLALDPSQLSNLMKIPKAERDRAKELSTIAANTGLGILGAPKVQWPYLDQQARERATQMGMDPNVIPPVGSEQYEAFWRDVVAKGNKTKALLDQVPDTPSGYQRAEGGGLEFTPGGPADPMQAGRLAAAKRKPGEDEAKAPAGYRWRGDGAELEPIPGGEHDPGSSQNRFKRSTKLRNEFTKASGDWIKVRDAASRVEESAKDDSAAGDLAMIFNYMKVLDPGSVVRESEFATAAASGSWGDRIAAAGGKILAGTRLSDDQRNDFLDRSRRLATAQHKQQKNLAKEYTGLANRSDVSPDNVVVNYTEGFSPYGPSETTSEDVSVSSMGAVDLVKMLNQKDLSQQTIDEIDKRLKELGY